MSTIVLCIAIMPVHTACASPAPVNHCVEADPEFLYGYPPFNAPTTEQVFDNILNRRIAWPDEEEVEVSDDAKDLMNRLMCLDPKERLGSNKEGRFANGGEEIMAHPWFVEINWGD